MPSNNLALYRLLVKFGASTEDAERAAALDASDLATKGDLLALKADVAELKADLLKWGIATLLTVVGLQTGVLLFVLTHWKP